MARHSTAVPTGRKAGLQNQPKNTRSGGQVSDLRSIIGGFALLWSDRVRHLHL